MSSVANHNVQYFNFVDIPGNNSLCCLIAQHEHCNLYLRMLTLPTASSIKDFDVSLVSDVSYLFRRFKPDNVMHVFHDDLVCFTWSALAELE